MGKKIKKIAGTLAAAGGLYVWNLRPYTKRKDKMRAFMEKPVAHRGLFDNATDAPENSLAAFRLAVEAGYAIELDVQLTKDNRVVVIHDDNLQRVCGVDKRVSELTFRQLQEYTLFQSQQTIPLFGDVLQLIDGRVPLVMEIKAKTSCRALCERVAAIMDSYRGVYCMESFSPLALLWYRRHRPEILRGQLSTDFSKDTIEGSSIVQWFLQNLQFNGLTKPDFVAYNIHYSDGLALHLYREKFDGVTAGWTYRSREDWEKYGTEFDIHIFDGYHGMETDNKNDKNA